MEHLTRVHQVIRMDQVHALLVGVGGSGGQSVSKLTAFAAECDLFEITLSHGYREEEFQENLKTLYHKQGIENKKVYKSLMISNTLLLSLSLTLSLSLSFSL